MKQRQILEKDWGENLESANNNGNAFRGTLRKLNRDIAICRELATASKHVEVTQGADESIDAVVSARTERAVDSEGNEIAIGDTFVVVPSWKLKVQDGDLRREFLDVLDGAIDYWERFLKLYT